MSPEEAASILKNKGIDGLIEYHYAGTPELKIALMRIHHAITEAENFLSYASYSLGDALAHPTDTQTILGTITALSTAKLRNLANELEKSVRTLCPQKEPSRASTEETLHGRTNGHGRPPDIPRPRSDWDDVPF